MPATRRPTRTVSVAAVAPGSRSRRRGARSSTSTWPPSAPWSTTPPSPPTDGRRSAGVGLFVGCFVVGRLLPLAESDRAVVVLVVREAAADVAHLIEPAGRVAADVAHARITTVRSSMAGG